MAASVSASPPRDTALRTASSKLSDSKGARNRFRHGALAGFVKMVVGADLVDSPRQVVAVCGGNCLADLCRVLTLKREPDSVCCCPCAFHAFGVVVGDGGYLVGRGEGSVEVVAVQERRGRDAHRRAVAVTFIGCGYRSK